MDFLQHIYPNGLTLLVHEDHDTPLVTVNLLYKVGSRNEQPNRTGFAHLFEHLMFGGTEAIPDYDAAVDEIFGENNAFTNSDFTDYYLTVPKQYVERALQIEADRMRGLVINDDTLRVQQSVVTEEYKQRYLNEPYGDSWLLIRPLCYQQHPYRWATIGADIRHVQEATTDDVRKFYDRYYRPDNAILIVAGNVEQAEVVQMVERHFGAIKNEGAIQPISYPTEPQQTQQRRMVVEREVPTPALYIAFPMCERKHPDFKVYDTISDLLSNGDSSRLYNALVKEQHLFTEIDAFVSGEEDAGLFMVIGKLTDDTTLEQAEEAVWKELAQLQEVQQAELDKVVNKYEANFIFSQYNMSDRAQMLGHYQSLGMVDLINNEPQHYRTITIADVQRVAQQCFRTEQSNILYYKVKGSSINSTLEE